MLQPLTLRKIVQPVLKGIANPVFLALGANQTSPFGTPAETIRESLKELKKFEVDVLAVSRLFQTPAFPPSSGSDYVNAAALCKCELEPTELLATLHRVEELFRRDRQRRWASRTLDIDLLAVGDLVLPDHGVHQKWRGLDPQAQAKRTPDQLILPHPRLQDRAFVLIPLADVAPDWMHPILGLTVNDMLAELPTSAQVGIRPL